MSGLSYLYSSIISSVDSYDLSTLDVPSGGIMTITTGGGLSTPGIALAGTDYIASISSSTGLVIGPTVDDATPINFTGSPAAGNLLVGNGGQYAPLTPGTLGYVLTVTDVTPFTIGWMPAGSGDPATWAQYPADADVDLQDPVTTTTYHRLKNVSSVSFHAQAEDFSPSDNAALWSYVTGGKAYQLFGSSVVGIGNLIQGTFADIANGNYAANGSILRGNGTTYDAYPIGPDNYILTVSDGTFVWAPGPGDISTWSQYEATVDVDMDGYSVKNINVLTLLASIAPEIEDNVGIFHVNSGVLPKFSSPTINNHFLVTSDDADDEYATLGAILTGNGTDYQSLPTTSIGDVLTVGLDLTPTWTTPSGASSSTIATVNCVMWISSGYTGLAAYTYNNGTAGVGATLTYNSNFALTPSYIDNYNGANGSAGVLAGIRILVVDNNNPTYSGIYTLTQVGSGGTPPILTRAADWNSSSEMITGRRIYVTPYIPARVGGGFVPYSSISTFSGQFISFMTAAPITIGTTPFTFASSVFTAPSFITGKPLSPASPFAGFTTSGYFLYAIIPDGGRVFFPSSFNYYVEYITGSGTMTGWNMSLGNFQTTNPATYTPYTQTFACSPQTLATPASVIIPLNIGNSATSMNPNQYMGFTYSGAPGSNSGTFNMWINYYGQWVG